MKFILPLLFVFLSTYAVEPWMKSQVDHDLAPFRKGYCQNCLYNTFKTNSDSYGLCLIISDHQGARFIRGNDKSSCNMRFLVIRRYFTEILKELNYPPTMILISLGDSWPTSIHSPAWVMCKLKGDNKILFPDFEALDKKYNMIKGIDLEKKPFPIPWEDRHNRMIWRGSGAQGKINSENMYEKSRVILCLLSHAYPHLIDAGFTTCIPACLEPFRKNRMSIEEIFSHRYQIWIDGNASSYSNSGWRLYSGSTVFKEDSDYVQWYFQDLKPWVHYIPVDKGLDNLVERLIEIQEDEVLGREIASNGREFAITHISSSSIREYMMVLMKAYLSCPFTAVCKRCSK